MPSDYNDDYPTCIYTYATLGVYADEILPLEISSLLNVQPSRTFEKGAKRTNKPQYAHSLFHTNAWFYSTQGLSASRDCRRHLDILIETVLRDLLSISKLQDLGAEMSVAVYYEYTQGGPTISPKQMKVFSDANIDVWWDLYRGDDEDLA